MVNYMLNALHAVFLYIYQFNIFQFAVNLQMQKNQFRGNLKILELLTFSFNSNKKSVANTEKSGTTDLGELQLSKHLVGGW